MTAREKETEKEKEKGGALLRHTESSQGADTQAHAVVWLGGSAGGGAAARQQRMRQEREINRRVRELGINVSANELSPTVIAVQLAYPQLRAVTSAFACLAGEDNNYQEIIEKHNPNQGAFKLVEIFLCHSL